MGYGIENRQLLSDKSTCTCIIITDPYDPRVDSAKETAALLDSSLHVAAILHHPHDLESTEVRVDGKPTLWLERGGREQWTKRGIKGMLFS